MTASEVEGRPEGAARGGGRFVHLAVIGSLMVAEGIGIFYVANALHESPYAAVAGEGVAVGGAAGAEIPDELAEVELAECRPGNSTSGKFVSFQIRVSGLVAAADADLARQLVKARQARINDRVNYVIRSAELPHLSEPGLDTIKRRLKHELSAALETEGLIKEILIPEFLR